MITALISALVLDSNISGVAHMGRGFAKNAVVFLEDYGRPKPVSAEIDQRHKTFNPHILVVPVGSSVSFPNHDLIYHNVFANYNAKKFDLGMYPSGQTRKVRFDKPGLVSVLCNVHSEMSAYIVVVNSSAYAVTDSNGRFTLKGVAPGRYRLRGWQESGARVDEEVTVQAGTTLDVQFKR